MSSSKFDLKQRQLLREFECRMSRRTRERLRDALRELNLQSGYVLAWRAAGRKRDLAIGQAPATADLDAAFVV